MDDYFKEVYFDEYCPKCEYKDLTEDMVPCDECLCAGVNINSHKPVKYKEAKKS